MKSFCLSILSIIIICALPAVGHEHQPIHFNIEQRLNQIDSSLLLRQYEQLKMHAFEARMKLDLLELEPHHDSKESKQRKELMSKRAKTLESEAAKIRERAIKLAEQNRLAQRRFHEEHRHLQHDRIKYQDDRPSEKQSEKNSGCKKSECSAKKENKKK